MTVQQYPEPTVGGLIFNQKGELFLMRSHKWRDIYTVPGGHIELGETMEQALIREVKEETNLDIYNIEFVDYQEFIFDDEFWKKRHFIFFDFSAKTDSNEVILNHEAQEYIWKPLENVFELPMDKYTKRAIQRYIEIQNESK
jgi:nucleoside triphosphatase